MLTLFVLAYKFVVALRFLERDEHRICAWSGAQRGTRVRSAHIFLFLGFRMVELVLFNVFLTLTTLSDTRPPHAGSAAVAFNTRPMTRDVRYKGTHHRTHHTTLPHGGFSSTVALAFLGTIAPI